MKAAVLSTLAAMALATPVAAQDHANHVAAQPAAKVKATGVVKGVDAKTNTITVAHDPITALGWPAMTMSFKVASPSLLKGLKAGDRVRFDLRAQQITAIRRG
ncbi:MAG: copper-binding protein [Proteobacteria bacterium]|nr:copper-binding protein [Pseudomonadota bacterium]